MNGHKADCLAMVVEAFWEDNLRRSEIGSGRLRQDFDSKDVKWGRQMGQRAKVHTCLALKNRRPRGSGGGTEDLRKEPQ